VNPRHLATALFALMCACAAPPPAGWRAVEIEAEAATLGTEQAGELTFLGGVELTSRTRGFGGLSDIHVAPDGAFIAITDAGAWVRGRLMLDARGAPTGIADVAIAAMRDERGRAFANKAAGDSEGLATLADGRIAVSFEQTQTIRLYPPLGAAPGAALPGPALAETTDLPLNAGLEAIAPLGAALLVGSEDKGRLWLAEEGAARPAPPVGALSPPLGFGLVELDVAPGGEVLALERFYAPGAGNSIRVLELTVQDGVRAREIAALDPPLALDNFEGLSVAEIGGARVVFLVSDNNFNDRQRTLIYAFAWPRPG
jgi:hypothetical protein